MTPTEQATPTPSGVDGQFVAVRPSQEGQESTGGPTGQSTTTPKSAGDKQDVARGRTVEGQGNQARHPSSVNR